MWEVSPSCHYLLNLPIHEHGELQELLHLLRSSLIILNVLFLSGYKICISFVKLIFYSFLFDAIKMHFLKFNSYSLQVHRNTMLYVNFIL